MKDHQKQLKQKTTLFSMPLPTSNEKDPTQEEGNTTVEEMIVIHEEDLDQEEGNHIPRKTLNIAMKDLDHAVKVNTKDNNKTENMKLLEIDMESANNAKKDVVEAKTETKVITEVKATKEGIPSIHITTKEITKEHMNP